MLYKLLQLAVSPFTITYQLVHFLVYNTTYLPLIYLLSICILIPFKIPLIPLQYIFELNEHSGTPILGQKSQDPLRHDAEWMISQFEMFSVTTFHFLMCSIYIGLAVGLAAGVNLSVISWFLTLKVSTDEILVEDKLSQFSSPPPVKVGNSTANGDNVKVKQETKPVFDDEWAEMERREKFAYLEHLKRSEHESTMKRQKLIEERVKEKMKVKEEMKQQDLSKNKIAAKPRSSSIKSGFGPGPQERELMNDVDDDEVFVYPTPKSDFEMNPLTSTQTAMLRNRLKRDRRGLQKSKKPNVSFDLKPKEGETDKDYGSGNGNNSGGGSSYRIQEIVELPETETTSATESSSDIKSSNTGAPSTTSNMSLGTGIVSLGSETSVGLSDISEEGGTTTGDSETFES
ncbi:hypothetical protein KGF56_002203 [Candida oxycetoniae]|uniref:Uncharacterized protein n=1 Tax=Candida oxycetoniae TaxID=497107 RepID=A0AAI9SXS0_9ASCO|nr:uncharacterized protein KGF56_002203 [Candida oxycetoniae]KAI3405038.2 hypothetical protein KGF56_002203 [Candida oxycetoniae]